MCPLETSESPGKLHLYLYLWFFVLSFLCYLSGFSAFENIQLSGSHMKVNNISFDHCLRLKSSGLDIYPSTAMEQADMVLFLLAHSQRAEKVEQYPNIFGVQPFGLVDLMFFGLVFFSCREVL